MTTEKREEPLLGHVYMQMVAADSGGATAERNQLVRLYPDHPGFSDAEYRARRNRVARIASECEAGAAIPDAPYTPEEHRLWRMIRDAFEPRHRRHMCAEQIASFPHQLEVAVYGRPSRLYYPVIEDNGG
jgi:hypothetical protein